MPLPKLPWPSDHKEHLRAYQKARRTEAHIRPAELRCEGRLQRLHLRNLSLSSYTHTTYSRRDSHRPLFARGTNVYVDPSTNVMLLPFPGSEAPELGALPHRFVAFDIGSPFGKEIRQMRVYHSTLHLPSVPPPDMVIAWPVIVGEGVELGLYFPKDYFDQLHLVYHWKTSLEAVLRSAGLAYWQRARYALSLKHVIIPKSHIHTTVLHVVGRRVLREEMGEKALILPGQKGEWQGEFFRLCSDGPDVLGAPPLRTVYLVNSEDHLRKLPDDSACLVLGKDLRLRPGDNCRKTVVKGAFTPGFSGTHAESFTPPARQSSRGGSRASE